MLRARLAVLALLALACAPPPPAGLTLLPGPGASDPARPAFHDFGRVSAGRRVEHTYLLRNDSERAVQIQDVVPGCGCTVPSVRYRAADGTVIEGRAVLPGRVPGGALLDLPPGRTAEISLAIQTSDVRPQNAQRLLTARVTTDSPATPFFTLETSILVEQPFQVVPARLDLGDVPESGGGEGRVRVTQTRGFALVPTGAAEADGGFTVSVEPGEALGTPYWDVVAQLPPPVPLRRVRGVATLAVRTADDEPAPPLAIELSATGVPDVAAQPARLIVVARADDEAAEASVELASLLPGARLVVRSVAVPAEHADLLAAEVAPLAPDAAGRSPRWRVTLRARPALRARHAAGEVLSGALAVALADAQEAVPATTEVPYVVHVR